MYIKGYSVPIVILWPTILVSYFYATKPAVDKMANNGIVFISNVAKVHMACQRASKFVQRVLYIKIKGNSDHDSLLPMLSKQIDNFYAKASAHCGHLDVRLMLKYCETLTEIKTKYPIDMILYDNDLTKDIDQLKTCVATVKNDYKLQSIDCQETVQETGENRDVVKTYENVALGGTFDRLHNGHKILLSQAVLRATKLVTVGVTDVNMIQSKKLWELIEPVEVRMMEVLNFLKDINPDLEYNVFPLQDLYGPTKDDPKYQLIVISDETMKGAIKINEKRVQNGLLPMDIHSISLAEDTHSERTIDEEAKLSSSNQRMRLLGTLLKPPVPNTNIPAWPYVIGLAGGIASGKSSITKYLKDKGAGIVNCDIIAHELYRPGMPLNETIADTFGRDVIMESGEVDRKKLGQIVFSDKAQLEKLNSIIWPAVIEEAQRQFKVYGEKGYRVVVMEAAVLVQAKWYHYCHQLWSVIIPKDEAIKRLQDRNNLSEEDARMRVEAQPSNLKQIEHANVVFSPFWSYKYTQRQVDRAWNVLQAYLDTRQ